MSVVGQPGTGGPAHTIILQSRFCPPSSVLGACVTATYLWRLILQTKSRHCRAGFACAMDPTSIYHGRDPEWEVSRPGQVEHRTPDKTCLARTASGQWGESVTVSSIL